MKLTDKRFWIMEALCLLPSVCPIYLFSENPWYLFIATCLLSGIISGIYGYAYFYESFSNLFLRTWLSYNIALVAIMSIICIFSESQLLGYMMLFGFIVAIYTLIPFLIVTWLYKLIIKKMT